LPRSSDNLREVQARPRFDQQRPIDGIEQDLLVAMVHRQPVELDALFEDREIPDVVAGDRSEVEHHDARVALWDRDLPEPVRNQVPAHVRVLRVLEEDSWLGDEVVVGSIEKPFDDRQRRRLSTRLLLRH